MVRGASVLKQHSSNEVIGYCAEFGKKLVYTFLVATHCSMIFFFLAKKLLIQYFQYFKEKKILRKNNFVININVDGRL